MRIGWQAVAAATGGIIVLYYLGKHEAVHAVEQVGRAVNPVNSDNVFNQAADGVFHAISGDNVDSIGTWLYGVLHPDEASGAAWQHARPPRG